MRSVARGSALVCALLATSVGLAACGSSGSSSSAGGSSGATASSSSSTGAIVLGDDDDLSGPLSVYGQYTLTFIRAAVSYANAHGGVNGHQIKIVTADAAATGQNASSAAEQLIDSDHVSAIFGFTLSDDCGAVAPLAAAHQVPLICSSTPPQSLAPVQKYVFGGTTVEAQEVPASISFAQHLKVPAQGTFATIVAGSLGAQLYASKVATAAEQAGWKEGTAQVIPLTAVDASTQISQVVDSHPQVVFAEPVSSDILPLIKSLRAAGNNAPVIVADASVGYTGFTSIKDQNLYTIGPAEYITDLGTAQQGAALAVQALKTQGQTTLAQINQVLGPQAFVGPYAAIQALKSCGYPCTGSALANALEHTSVSLPGLVSGSFSWTPSLHLGFHQLYIFGYDPTTGQPKVVESGLPVGSLDG